MTDCGTCGGSIASAQNSGCECQISGIEGIKAVPTGTGFVISPDWLDNADIRPNEPGAAFSFDRDTKQFVVRLPALKALLGLS